MIFTTGLDPANPSGNGTHTSSTAGDSFKFQFAGSSISVNGIQPWQTSGNMTVAFSVDDEPTTTQTFPRGNHVSYVTTTTNYAFFEDDSLSSGNHTLTVNIIEVNGNSSMIVDCLTYIPSFSTLASKPHFTNSGSSSTVLSTSTASSAAKLLFLLLFPLRTDQTIQRLL
ncbi:hypothetical protein BT96DRAFT_522469 [Gymnopus androsaceus JB14]|uniref:Uncharacterized protein n=1 Tax=Gymnopus androsaceus JB14 TaxID=1447944 RepID=A0A6A4HWJ6_9AGAR|nr:hypothetical protein BT96DRAFT_522469 [Gymnopus androsaceus JB14]